MSRLLRLSFATILLLITTAQAAFTQVANFGVFPVSGCAPLLVNFPDSSTGAITGWNWNFGNSTTSTLQNASTTYSNPGTYTVSLTVTGPGGTNTKTATITVYDKPSVSFFASKLADCAPFTPGFTATVVKNAPGPVSYFWDFGDGLSDTATAPYHTYSLPGTYTVTLTVTNGAGCVGTAVNGNYVTAYQNPSADFSVSTSSFCSAPATATFVNTSTAGTGPYTASWVFGDGGTGNGNTISHTYNSGGAFTAVITVKDANGCSSTKSDFITVTTTLPTFSASSTACVNELVNFVNTTPNPGAANWYFGDNDSSYGSATTHFYGAPGIDTITMTTLVNGCPKTVKRTILINPLPVVSLTQYPSIPCPAPTSVQFTANASNALTYEYKDGQNNVIATTSTFTKYYTKNKADTLTLIVTTAKGCKDSVRTDTIYIRDISAKVYPFDMIHPVLSGCAPFDETYHIDFTTGLPPPGPNSYPGSILTWAWDFGDGGTDTLSAPNHIYKVVGDYSIRYIVSTSNGCIDTGYYPVHVDTKVHPSFYADKLNVCPRDSVTFYNTTHTSLTGMKYLWTLIEWFEGPVDTSAIKLPFYIADTTKDILLVSDHNGCTDSAFKPAYINVYPPAVFFTDSIYCPPSRTIRFTNFSKKVTSFLWDYGDHTTSTLWDSTHTYAQAGKYDVKLTVHNSTYGCSDSLGTELNIYDKTMDFLASDSAICTHQYVEFTSYFKGNGHINYSWIIDGVQTPFDSFKIEDHQYITKGFHDVTLIANSEDGACFDTLTKHNYVLVSRPSVDFVGTPGTGCIPMTVNFSDLSTNAPTVPTIWRRWIFSTGDTIYHAPHDTTYTFFNRGSYQVFLTVEDSLGCFDSLTKVNYISARKPVAAFSVNQLLVCNKAPVTFTSTSTAQGPMRYQWTFGDGSPDDTGRQIIHRYLASGTYTVRLVVSDTIGCKDTTTKTIISDAPIAGFYMSDSLAICPPLIIQFLDSSKKAVNYKWYFNAIGGPVGIANPVHTFATPGVYKVMEVAFDYNGCTDTALSTVRVLGYNGAFSYTPLEGCVPMLVAFSPPTNGIPRITWDFADGSTLTTAGTAASHFYSNPGAYLPRVIFSDGKACSSPSMGLDTIFADKVQADFTWTAPCLDTPFNLSQASSGIYKSPDSWLWVFGGGDTATGPSPYYTFKTAGNHSVTLVAINATGCRDTVTKQIMVNTLPIVVAAPDKGLCPGDSTTLWATGASSYVWTPAGLVSCTHCDSAIVHILPDPTWYYVTGIDANGCVSRDSTKVYMQLGTTDTTGPGGAICVGESFRLFAGGADHYLWLPAETVDSPAIASPLATPHKTTTYLLIAQEGTCKVDSVYVTVAVHSDPVFSAGNDQTIGRGSATTLHPTQTGISRIEWRADTSLSCLDCFLPVAHPRYTRTYYATGYNEYGCATTDSVTVFVRCDGDLVFVPNTFSPNGDGNNDYFFPRGEGVDMMSSFRVFNRWGEMVFERNNVALNDEKAGWDGSYRGKALPPDVYVYTMQSVCDDGQLVRWKGDVTLMR